MQTFLTSEYWRASAATLDDKRLNKQILEAGQILVRLVPEIYFKIFPEGKGPSKAWGNHPAVKMWEGSAYWLACYLDIHCEEWAKRTGKRHVLYDRVKGVYDELREKQYSYPEWSRREDFIKSHQSNLLRKDFEFYSKFGWDVPANLEYVWPSKEVKED